MSYREFLETHPEVKEIEDPEERYLAYQEFLDALNGCDEY